MKEPLIPILFLGALIWALSYQRRRPAAAAPAEDSRIQPAPDLAAAAASVAAQHHQSTKG